LDGIPPERSQPPPRIVLHEAVCSRCRIIIADSRDLHLTLHITLQLTLHIDKHSQATHQLDEFSRRTRTPRS